MGIEGEAGRSPGFLLWRATQRWQREINAALQVVGMSHVQFALLVDLWWFDHRGRMPTPRELAEHATVDDMMTSQVIRVLEVKGLLTREIDPTEERRRVLAITDEGRRLAERAAEIVDSVDRQVFHLAGPENALIDVLNELAKSPAS
ncbi:MarR family transcriptional regulator [Acrocarpospora corrugata]|uniref:MarR family transcriptional regulator n=1 Tax=Acrocarpospora corrugata TaxID=35763 RepID=A0A5M3WBN6_9ACTN|nr:MarR family winged helix-turn-helix transcriptional regulator [Acrocarpospora corrugata]GES04573.1 MarR family transcriptional regulator [Acrocarpospora corrugata]